MTHRPVTQHELALAAVRVLQLVPGREGSKLRKYEDRIGPMRTIRKFRDVGGGYVTPLDEREAEDNAAPGHSLVHFVRDKVLPLARWHVSRSKAAGNFSHLRNAETWAKRRARLRALIAEVEVFVRRCEVAAEIADPTPPPRSAELLGPIPTSRNTTGAA